MKKILTPVLLFAVLSTGAQTDTTEVPTDSVIVQMIALPDLTAIGAPDGKLVSKEIGSSGGTIISEDGKVELIFPEGALTTTTTISIQPTTNLVPNGNGKAYQFEPSGTRFLKPVSLIFHYTLKEAEACPPELMFLAIQDSKGKWEYMDYEDWDSTAKSLKGFITHFSQVVNGNLAELIPGEETIKVKSSKTFSLNIVTIPADATTPDVDEGEDYLPPLPAIAPLGNYKATWLVNETVGGTAKFGKIVPGENKSHATYTAPGLLPAEYAVKVKLKVSLYITNKEKTTKAGKRTGKMIKMQQTRLEDQKTFVSIISLYDEYDVKIDLLMDNTNLGPFTQKWTDESSFRLRVGKDPGISNISNNVYKLVKENFTNNKCQFVYRNSATCKGPIHVTGTIGVGLSGGSASRYATAMVDFVRVPWELPNLQITCPGGSIPSMTIPGPAFPHKMKFELKTGTFTEEYVGAADFLPGGKITMTLKQVTEE